MAEEPKGQSTMRGIMVALVVIAVLGGLYGVFSAVEAGFERVRGQIDSASRQTSMEIKSLRETTSMILEHERREAAEAAQPAPAAEPAAPAPEPTKAAPAPTKAAPAPTKSSE